MWMTEGTRCAHPLNVGGVRVRAQSCLTQALWRLRKMRGGGGGRVAVGMFIN